jgi:von Willebrand factor type A domain
MKLALGLCSSLLLTLVACGSSAPDNTFPPAPPPATDPGATEPGTGFDPATPPATPSKPADSLNACATSSAAAVPKAVYLVFAYDQSGSMAGSGKWTAAGAAMRTFFESADSKGINASMTLFPKYTAFPLFCDSSAYAAPDVGVTTLPSTMFGKAIDATAPQPGQGGTPTAAALTGTMAYAQGLLSTVAKDATVAVVMVTDGIPEVCGDKGDVAPATLVATTNASTVPTYVVGVGNSLANLNQIAVGGGTKSAFVVSVGDPLKTQTELSAAIKTIKGSALSCDYKIPNAPDGKTFDKAKVNVQYTPLSGPAKVLDYNPACTSGTGWRYDDAAHPTRVLACDATCNAIKNDGSKVDIVFGCATQAVGVK